jgi:hypothetical protein
MEKTVLIPCFTVTSKHQLAMWAREMDPFRSQVQIFSVMGRLGSFEAFTVGSKGWNNYGEDTVRYC